jgi:TIGR03009 family protein
MRLAGIVLAILLVAACPPRRGRVVYVQPGPVPIVTVAAQPMVSPSPPVTAEKPLDPVLEGHLLAWEKKVAEVKNVHTEIALKRTDVVFKKEANFTGSVLCLKPNCAILRLENASDPTKTDYEAYIYDGKLLYVYEGAKKTVTEIKAPGNSKTESLKSPLAFLTRAWEGFFWDNPVLALLTEPTAKAINERFDVTLFKTDEHYIYLDIKPLRPADQREFKQLRLALYGPGQATAQFAYLPVQLYMLKLNGDTEVWKFSNTKVDIPNVNEQVFKFKEVPKGWTFLPAPEPKPKTEKP